jgi:hypothetical protein
MESDKTVEQLIPLVGQYLHNQKDLFGKPVSEDQIKVWVEEELTRRQKSFFLEALGDMKNAKNFAKIPAVIKEMKTGKAKIAEPESRLNKGKRQPTQEDNEQIRKL